MITFLSFTILLLHIAPDHANLVLQQSKNFDNLCMDGTSSGYYWAQASGTIASTPSAKPMQHPNPSSVWILHLEGGGWCWSPESCQQRCGTPASPKTSSSLCSSTTWPTQVSLNGVFNANDPTLQSANKIFVKYCTSDGHMGNTTAHGWRFRGASVIQKVLTELVEIHGLGSGANNRTDTLLFGGASAGGRGAMVHLDYVRQMVGTKAAKNILVRGFLDSPLWMDLPSINPKFPGFNVTTAGVFHLANVSHTDEKCIQQYSKTNEGWKCLMGQYRMPFVRTPYIISASQNDLFQTYEDIGHPPMSNKDYQYMLHFANVTKTEMLQLNAMNPQAHAVFSWGCFNHAVSMTNDGFNVWKAGESPDVASTMNDAVVEFLWGQGGEGNVVNQWVDRCNGWKCGTGC